MATQAPTTQVVQSSTHALERLHRPLVDVLRPALVRHGQDWKNSPAQGGRDLALALILLLGNDAHPAYLDQFAVTFNAAYLRRMRETTVAAPGTGKSFGPNASLAQLLRGTR
jgi:hypothetical protein